MKIKLSKGQWEFIGKQAGWVKQAGVDYIVNESYTKNVAQVLMSKNIDIVSISQYVIKVNYKLPKDKQILLGIQVFQDKNTSEYIAVVYINKQVVAMVRGISAKELIQNFESKLKTILRKII